MLISSIYIYNVLYFSDPFVYFFPQKKKIFCLFLVMNQQMGEMSSFQLGVIGALFLSVASSVSIVICNKALMSNLGFPFGTQPLSLVNNLKVDVIMLFLFRLFNPFFFLWSLIFFFFFCLVIFSDNTHKLASDGNILHSPCRTTLEFL